MHDGTQHVVYACWWNLQAFNAHSIWWSQCTLRFTLCLLTMCCPSHLWAGSVMHAGKKGHVEDHIFSLAWRSYSLECSCSLLVRIPRQTSNTQWLSWSYQFKLCRNSHVERSCATKHACVVAEYAKWLACTLLCMLVCTRFSSTSLLEIVELLSALSKCMLETRYFAHPFWASAVELLVQMPKFARLQIKIQLALRFLALLIWYTLIPYWLLDGSVCMQAIRAGKHLLLCDDQTHGDNEQAGTWSGRECQ